jgi:23S rRNA (uracil1939-C5)-methyltransferase
MIRTSSIGEIMVLVQFYTATQKQIETVLDFLKASHPEITALLYVS